MTQVLGTSESRSSLRHQVQAHTMQTVERSIEEIKNRELLNGHATSQDGFDALLPRSRTTDQD